MKKLLGISLVAALAVAPSLARAEAGDRTVTALDAQAATASANIATTSYVQGAYKATADKIDALIEDTAVVENGNYIDAGKTVSHNLSELDTAIKTVADNVAADDDVTHTEGTAVAETGKTLHYVAADGTKVGENLGHLDAQVYANTVAISAETQRAQGVESGLSGRIGTIAADGTYIKDSGEKNVSENLVILDSALNTLSSTMTGDFATKEGVVATINHSTASGTVTVYDTWGTNNNQPVTVNSTVTSPATNAYYATVDAQSGVTQPVVAPQTGD